MRYHYNPDGTRIPFATRRPGFDQCPYSGRRVTEAQKRRKTRDCPICHAPDVPWTTDGQYTEHVVWGRHQRGVGSSIQLDLYPVTASDDIESFNLSNVEVDTSDDRPVF